MAELADTPTPEQTETTIYDKRFKEEIFTCSLLYYGS